MSRKYKIRDNQKLYFVTFTVIHWIDVFIRNDYRDIIVDSIKYCQKNKGLEVYAWCIMTSHVHLIIGSDKEPLIGIIRDLKSFTSRAIRKKLEDNEWLEESRKIWMYNAMKYAGTQNGNNNDFQLWQQHSHPIEIDGRDMMDQKAEYIHMNPVKAGFIDRPEAWQHSSAIDFYENRPGLIELHTS